MKRRPSCGTRPGGNSVRNTPGRSAASSAWRSPRTACGQPRAAKKGGPSSGTCDPAGTMNFSLSAGMRLGGRWLGAPQAVIWDLADGRVTAEFVGVSSDMPNLIWALDAATVAWVRPGPTEKSDPVVTITDVPTGKPRVLFDAPG